MKTHIAFLTTLILVLAGCTNEPGEERQSNQSTYAGNLQIEKLPEGAAEVLEVEDAVFVLVFNARGTAILYEAPPIEPREIELPKTLEALLEADDIMRQETQSITRTDNVTNSNSFSVLSYEGSFCVVIATSAGYARVVCPPQR